MSHSLEACNAFVMALNVFSQGAFYENIISLVYINIITMYKEQKKSRFRHRQLINTLCNRQVSLNTCLLHSVSGNVLGPEKEQNPAPAFGQYTSIQRYTGYFPIDQLPVPDSALFQSITGNWTIQKYPAIH